MSFNKTVSFFSSLPINKSNRETFHRSIKNDSSKKIKIKIKQKKLKQSSFRDLISQRRDWRTRKLGGTKKVTKKIGPTSKNPRFSFFGNCFMTSCFGKLHRRRFLRRPVGWCPPAWGLPRRGQRLGRTRLRTASGRTCSRCPSADRCETASRSWSGGGIWKWTYSYWKCNVGHSKVSLGWE